jgi:HlyD family secretion protein
MKVKKIGSGKRTFSLLRNVLLLSLATALIAGGFSGCRTKGVTTVQVKAMSFTKTVSATGSIEPCNPQYVYPGATGPIASLNVQDGDRVEAGQVLASVDRAALEAEARKAESNYLTQASMGQMFSSLFADMDSMFDIFNSTLDVVDHYKSSVDTVVTGLNTRLDGLVSQLPEEARAQVEEAARQAREEYQRLVAQAPSPSRVAGSGYPSLAATADDSRAQLALEQYQEALHSSKNNEVRAPASGNVFFVTSGGLVPEDLVSSIKSKAGGFTSSLKFLGGGMESMFEDTILKFVLPELELKTGSNIAKDKPAFMICDFSKVDVRLDIEEADIAMVKPGQKVDVTLEALRGEDLQGVVKHVAMRPSVSFSETPVYEVIAEVDAGRVSQSLRLGYTANAEIRVIDKEEAIMLPLEAVVMEPYPHVFVVQDGRARLRKVRLGAEDEDRVEVIGGLKASERVVIKGAGKVKEGSEV